MKRYHSALVVLHWLLAVAIIGMLIFGFFILSETPNANPHKIDILMWHMAAGMAILALMLVRVVVRICTTTLDATKADLKQKMGFWSHIAFYIVIFGVIATGFATAILARLNEIVFAGSGEPLPQSFNAFPTWVAHGFLNRVLLVLILTHIGLVVFRSFKGEEIIARMSMGRGRED